MTLDDDFMALCATHNIEPSSVRAPIRNQNLVDVRHAIAKELRKKGYAYIKIGLVLNRDHTSIQYMCKTRFRERKKKRMRGYYNEQAAG